MLNPYHYEGQAVVFNGDVRTIADVRITSETMARQGCPRVHFTDGTSTLADWERHPEYAHHGWFIAASEVPALNQDDWEDCPYCLSEDHDCEEPYVSAFPDDKGMTVAACQVCYLVIWSGPSSDYALYTRFHNCH